MVYTQSMAKMPSVEKIIADPKAREGLTDTQLAAFIQQLQKMTAGLGRAAWIPDNPGDFAASLSGGDWKHAAHLDLLSSRLRAVERREIRKLMVSMPPRHGKSMLIDIFLPLWWLAKHPKDQIILAGYGETFARSWGAKVRDLVIEHSEKLNLQLNRDKTAADEWAVTAGGGLFTVGVGGGVTGRGANLLIVDDPIKNDEEANSKAYRDSMWDWWQATVSTRLEPGGCVVVVATRWHQDDLLGRIEENNDGSWEILKIPAIAEKNDVLGRAEGEALWPERFYDDPDYSKKKSGMSPYWWSALYQQRPSPEGGGKLLRDWWRFYVTAPDKFDQVIQSWDLALKDKKTSDFSVGQVWGRKGASLYLLAQARGHYSMADVVKHMKHFQAAYGAVLKLVEDTAMGPILKQTMQHEVSGIVPVSVIKTSKMSRVENAIPYLMGGNIYLPENESGTKQKWVWDFIEECAAFDKGTHDDQVDAFAHAIGFLQPESWRHTRQQQREVEENIPETSPEELRRAWFQKKMVEQPTKRMMKQFNPRPKNQRLW